MPNGPAKNAAPRLTKSGKPDKRFGKKELPAAMVAQQKVGRPKGAKDKLGVELKAMIETALEQSHKDGGIGYLKQQAERNPVAFLGLLGKILPKQIDVGVSVLAVDLMDVMQVRRNELAKRKMRIIEDAEITDTE